MGTALESTRAMFVLCLLTSFVELAISLLAVHTSNRRIQRMEAEVHEITYDNTLDLDSQQQSNFNGMLARARCADELAEARLRLVCARRQLSTEVLSLVNELLIELF